MIEDSKIKKIINLKFKKAFKKSIFSKIYAGTGTRDHIETGGMFNMFRDTLQISVIGVGNNLNRTGFTNKELYTTGGFNRGGQDANISFGGSGYSGIQKSATGGFNINTDYGKKFKINLLYFYTYTQNGNNSITSRQQFINDTTLTTNSNDDSHWLEV